MCIGRVTLQSVILLMFACPLCGHSMMHLTLGVSKSRIIFHIAMYSLWQKYEIFARIFMFDIWKIIVKNVIKVLCDKMEMMLLSFRHSEK